MYLLNRRRFCAALASCASLVVSDTALGAQPYKQYALSLVRNLPGDARFRPDLEAALAGDANAYRAAQGRKPLKPDELLQVPARAHAADMMIHNFIGHRASTGHDFDSRMRVFLGDITRFPEMAENAARQDAGGVVDVEAAARLFQQWVKSPPHRKALGGLDYAFVSTGVVQRSNSIWAVQIFWAKPREKGIFQ
jgi:uncharacterized protein YkwD